MWYHGSESPITTLRANGDPMNLWGSNGAYLTQDPLAAARFGPCLNAFSLEACNVLDVDAPIEDNQVDLLFAAYRHFNVPAYAFAMTQPRTYVEAFALLSEYASSREGVIDFFRQELRFDALLNRQVEGTLNGESFSEGDVLVLLDTTKAQWFASTYCRVPDNVYFHGSREKEPISRFEQGKFPAKAGFAGLGVYDVERAGFYFSRSVGMARQFGHVHSYQVMPGKTLDLSNDMNEIDADALRQAGLNPDRIDLRHEKWELFDGEDGQEFSDILRSIGYSDVVYYEQDSQGCQQPCLIVLDPDRITPLPLPVNVVDRHVALMALSAELADVYQDGQRDLTKGQMLNQFSYRCERAGVSLSTDQLALLVRHVQLRQDEKVLERLSTWSPVIEPALLPDIEIKVSPVHHPIRSHSRSLR